ncbi:MAG: peptide chain release factor N(5)-glutamine methyltransferase [Kiritimatiellae bacterium]|nr:peptide chain release factor N(5)-glutamine methyltransferase [Kiritimatiellia bacterium]
MFAEPQSADGRTLGDLIDSGAAWLGRRGVGDGRLLCEWLAAAALGRRRTDLPLAEAPPPDVVERLRGGLRRLGAGEPVQYVVGDWDFRMLTLKTDRRALIPRPETEGLVSLVLDEPGVWASGAPRICDIGTGTGAIALSLAYERPQCRVTAVDSQEAALSLARENAGRLGLSGRVEFILGENCAGAAPGSFDAIVSNPPYIESAAVDALPPLIRDHEPRSALDGGPDGLDTLRGVIHDSAIALRRGGFLFLEIGDGQGAAVRSLMEDAGFSEVAILKDLAGLIRYARGRIE